MNTLSFVRVLCGSVCLELSSAQFVLVKSGTAKLWLGNCWGLFSEPAIGQTHKANTDSQTDRDAGVQTETRTHTKAQTERQAEKQIDRHTYIHVRQVDI